MSTIKQIEQLFKEGVLAVTFTKTKEGKPVVLGEQAFPTEAGQSQFRHEATGDTFEEALERLQKMAYHCTGIRAHVSPVTNNLIRP